MFEALVDHSQDQLAYLDRDFRFVRVNLAYCAGCRRRAEDLIGRNHFELFPNAENEAIFDRVRRTGEPAVCREKPFVYPDQPNRGVTWWDWVLAAVKDGAGEVIGLVLSLHEVTDQVRARHAIEESEERFRLMADGTPALIWVTGPDGDLLFANRGYLEYFRVGQDELTGRRWQPLMHPEDAPAYVAAFMEAMRERRAFVGEVRVRHADGEWHWLASHGEPRLAPSGEFLGYVGISTDITALKCTEAALREADRNKDAFLDVLSHELRNPLAPILNGLSILDRADPGSAPAGQALEIVRRQVAQLARLVEDLLDVTRIGRGKMLVERSRVDLNDIVRQAAADYSYAFQKTGIRLEVALHPEPLYVDADAQRIAQVLGNLLQNAVKFTGRGGRTRVTFRANRGRAVVLVEDDGAGIEPEMLPRVFERFAQAGGTPNGSRAGLGLGLALAKGIVELHGGEISARSAGRNMGAQFEVSLSSVEPPDRS